GRHPARRARDSRHPLQPFRGDGVGGGDAEGPRQGTLPRRRGACSRGIGGVAFRSGQGSPAGAALCDQADRRGLERRRFHRTRGSRASAAGAHARRLALWRPGAGRKEYFRQGVDLRRHGRHGARGHRNRADGKLLRLRGEIRPRRLQASAARARFIVCLPTSPKTSTGGAWRAGLPGREPCGFPLRRSHPGDGGTRVSRSQYPARYDRNVARARTGGACGHYVRRAGAMDGRGRLAQSLKWIAALRVRRPASAAARGVADAKTARPRSRVARIMDRWSSLLAGKWPRGAGAVATGLIIFASAPYGAVKGDHIPGILAGLKEARDAIANAAGLRVTSIALVGNHHVSREEVLAAAGITGATALVFLDVDEMRQRLKGNPWIADATVLKLYPG